MPSQSLKISCRANDPDKHDKDVNNLLFYKGKLYSAADDGKIKSWTPDLTLVSQVQAHTSSVYSLAASEGALFSSSNDGSVKAWEWDTLKEKGTILNEKDTEFWVIRYVDGVLYVGDDQGNVSIIKNGQSYGSVNVAQPIKDMAINKNWLFTVKDKDVVITDLHLGGEKPQFGVKKTVEGRAPLTLFDEKVAFSDRSGKDLILAEAVDHFSQIAQVKGAHELIILALAGVSWDGKTILFSGGWDKIVKKWNVDKSGLKEEATLDIEIVINALTSGEKDQIYAAGTDGHIVRIDV